MLPHIYTYIHILTCSPSPDSNYCAVSNYPGSWDFDQWCVLPFARPTARVQTLLYRDNWAKTVAVNKNVKIYVGAPASSTAASGYTDLTSLINIALATRSQYSSFGGVSLWDASQAFGASPLLSLPSPLSIVVLKLTLVRVCAASRRDRQALRRKVERT